MTNKQNCAQTVNSNGPETFNQITNKSEGEFLSKLVALGVFSNKNPSTSTLKNSSIFQSCWIIEGNVHHVSQEPGEIPHVRYFCWLFPARIARAPFASQRKMAKKLEVSEGQNVQRAENTPKFEQTRKLINISCL